MFLRALRICSPEFLDLEFQHIFDIGQRLKYPLHFIEKSLAQAKKSFYRTAPSPAYNLRNMLVLPYNENFTHIPKLLKLFNVSVVFGHNSTVKNILIKNAPRKSMGCVYKIPCKSCDKSYIGQTGKELKIREKQHKSDILKGKETNAIFLHVRDFLHNIDWDNASQLVRCNSFVGRNLIESSFIKQSYDLNMNTSLGMYKLDPFIINFICKEFKFIK